MKISPSASLVLLTSIVARASTVMLSWNYDYTGLTICSAMVKRNCLDHFEMHDATDGTPVFIASVANPPDAGGKMVAISGAFQTSGFGQRVFAGTAVGRDSSGNFVSSDWTKCQGSFQVPPSAPSGLSGSATE